ncbi:hypothetical protein ACIBI9_06160 [Nonomuraea sp. NPDC050451]|uniref:hypothetical protein n=1 Tax=Nonomuraea sp. NPDC050451 TaxID=3364364 RepID=UPI00378EC12D
MVSGAVVARRAVRIADQVQVSGTTAQPPHLDGADAYQQDAGSSMTAVVRTVTYVTDIADAELVARAEVSGLLDPRTKVEIEVSAVEPN